MSPHISVNTSYVTVEPKRRKNPSSQKELQEEGTHVSTSLESPTDKVPKPEYSEPIPPSSKTLENTRSALDETEDSRTGALGGTRGRSSGRELRRARIVITLRRTESYTRWLEENPLQAMIANDGNMDAALEKAPGSLHEQG